MLIEILQQSEELETLRQEWNTLLEDAITATPFQLYEYQQIWWSTLGGGEWESGELWVAAGRTEAGKLVGLAPLFVTRDAEGRVTLQFVGSFEISDYLDLIVFEDRLEEFIAALFDALDENGPQGWSMLDLYNLPEESPSVEVLMHQAAERGWQVEQERLQPSPIVFLPDSWDDYLDQLDSKQSRELRRKLRKAQGYPASVDWDFVSEQSELPDAIETFLDLMANDAAKAEFLTDEMRSHFRQMCATAFENDWLQIAFLNVSGKATFGYVNFDFGNRIWVYNSGFDPAHFDLSPGWVLMGNLIQWAIENDREAVDFMRGDESYKYRLGGENRFVARVTIRR